MSMDAAVESPVAARGRAASAHVPRSWSGLEPAWVLAARASAPWPLFVALALVGVPGSGAPGLAYGALALALVFLAMVTWAHRPEPRALGRLAATVLGAGVMGELLAHALASAGRGKLAVSGLDDLPRALVIWVLAAGVYELAPIAAASARVVREEPRHLGRDLAAHALFAGLAALAYALPPEGRGDEVRWLLSPWMAVALALPFAAARSGPPREAALPAQEARLGPVAGLAVLSWGLTVGLAIADRQAVGDALRALDDGLSAAHGLRALFPALSLALALAAALSLFGRALGVRHAPHGAVASPGQDGFTLLRDGKVEPTWVALEGGAQLEAGATVTVLGVRPRTPDVGPFRDGAAQWRARRVWPGTPRGLARTLVLRGLGWLAWAGVGAAGVLLAAW